MYALGFSCQEITAQFPAFPLPLILYSRVREKWDELRHQFEAKVAAKAAGGASIAKLDATSMLSQIVQATNVKWRKELMDYLADPEKNTPPDFLPDSIHQFKQVIELLQGLTEQSSPKSKIPGDASGTAPLVSVHVHSIPSPAIEKIVEPIDIEAALAADNALKTR